MCWHKRRGTSKRWKKKPTKNPKRTLVSNGRDRVVDRSGDGKRRYRRNDALAAGERGQDTQYHSRFLWTVVWKEHDRQQPGRALIPARHG